MKSNALVLVAGGKIEIDAELKKDHKCLICGAEETHKLTICGLSFPLCPKHINEVKNKIEEMGCNPGDKWVIPGDPPPNQGWKKVGNDWIKSKE